MTTFTQGSNTRRVAQGSSGHSLFTAAACTELRRPNPRRGPLCMAAAESGNVVSPVQIADGRPRDVNVGVLGGGQLGRMLAIAAANLGVHISSLDPAAPAPAAVASSQTVGSFTDADAIKAYVRERNIDVLTVEIEHINVDALEEVQQELGVEIQPTPSTLRTIQDKFIQKQHFQANGVAVTDYVDIPDEATSSVQAAAEAAGRTFGFPYMLKSRRLAYDGRGNAVVSSTADLGAAVEALGGFERGLYAEKWAPFSKELSVMVARSAGGEIVSYPVVQTIHEDSILLITEAPADVKPAVADAARALARQAVGTLSGAGIFGVELFLLPDGSVAVNEVAPRPHNSGHYTMDACVTSQFEQALRAVLGWPLGETAQLSGSAIMYNILGSAEGDAGLSAAHALMSRAYATPGASVHWYDKADVVPKRKIGHVNISAPTRAEARRRLDSVVDGAAARLGGPKGVAPEVGIIMGSDSDLPTMGLAAQVLADFDIACEVTVVSAHRTPERMFEYARSAHTRGIKVIVAGAGGAAHLPGMVAALTPLPVIGVPVKPAGAHLDGLDALASIVQMPRGVPVATVAIGNATNAGLLAVRVLAASRPELQKFMVNFQNHQREVVEAKAARLEGEGWQAYMERMDKKA